MLQARNQGMLSSYTKVNTKKYGKEHSKAIITKIGVVRKKKPLKEKRKNMNGDIE